MSNVLPSSAPSPRHPAEGLRLYVLDCGKITQVGSREFGFQDGELANEFFTLCFLVAHPAGTLLWDTGEIPDDELDAGGATTRMRSFTVTKPLLPQLAARRGDRRPTDPARFVSAAGY